MVPSETLKLLRWTPRPQAFGGEYYAVEAVFLRELQDLMLRMFTEQRMMGDEMREWAKLLHLRLDEDRVLPIIESEPQPTVPSSLYQSTLGGQETLS